VSAKPLSTMPLEEVGTVPGSYRIVDMFCLREVLNQIMKCSCRSGEGFSLYQNLSTTPMSSFHCVLDIVCRSCRQKVSFGSSTLVSVSSSSEAATTRPDIDCKLSRLQVLSVRSLWGLLHHSDWAQLNQDPTLQHGQEEAEELHLLRSDTSQVDLSCSLVSTGELGCPLSDSPLDLGDCTITNTSLTLDCSSSPVQSSTLSCNTSKELLQSGIQPFYMQKHSTSLNIKKSGQNFERLKICQICNKQFKKLFNLKQHIRTHTNERPLKCEHCDKRFNDRSSMNKHVRTVHADFRPHTCKICSKHFSSSSHVVEHQATHTHSKKHACTLCDKKFAFRSSLNKHLGSHSAHSKPSDGRRLLQLKDCELDGL